MGIKKYPYIYHLTNTYTLNLSLDLNLGLNLWMIDTLEPV